MDFRILGQLQVWRDGERLALSAFKQRALVAILLIHANEAVSTDRIIDELWGDDAGTDRHNALWVHVSKLRSALEPDRSRGSDGSVLLTRPPGYLLSTDADQVDAHRFEQLVHEGRRLIDVDPAAAAVVLGEGLALWRGRPYEDFLYEPFAASEIVRLDEARLEAIELRVDADLRCGLSSELIGQLQALVRENPFREHLTAQLMLALYRSDRQAEALRTYGHLRSRLNEELGLDPSAALQHLEGQIIRADPALDRHAMVTDRPARLAIRGYELREPISSTRVGPIYRAFQPAAGREVAVTVIGPELANDVSFIRRFQAGRDVMASLRHPNIVPVDDQWREPDGAFVVTRLHSGRTLEVMLDTGSLPLSDAASIVGDVASALALAHRCGLVHGGIDAGAILVEDGHGFLSAFDFVAAGGRLTPAGDVTGLGRVLEQALAGSGTGPGSTVGEPAPSALAAIIERSAAPQPTDGFPDASSFAVALRRAIDTPARGADESRRKVLVNPYKGLHAFGEADAADFFGRERVVERVLARLGAGGSAGRFVAVVGASGSGKSSAVRAGLVPAIREGALPGSSTWFVLHITPGRYPYEEMATALRSIAAAPTADLLERLTDGPDGIARALRSVLPDDRSQLLLIIDQFEEIFTLAGDATRRSFLEALAYAISDRQSRLRVVITLRADFYDRPLGHHAFGELLRKATEPITAMSPQELQRAIEGPAERVDVRFEPGLVTQIVADVADHAAALPLLQYALTELFDDRRGRTIELSAYRHLGGAAGALARTADFVYDGFVPSAKEATRQIMLRLVNVGDGDDDVTRRRVLRQELAGLGFEQVTAVLDILAAHRLIAFDRDVVTRGPTVEIAHESLFVEWNRLRIWITEGRDDVRRHHRLAVAAEEWRASGGAADDLLRGGRLDEFVAFANRGEMSLTEPERAFLDTSISHREAELAAERAQAVKEARLRRSGRRRNALLIGGAVALAVATIVASTQVTKRRASDRLATGREQTQTLAAAATDVAEENPDLAMLLALHSLSTSERADLPAPTEAEDALHWAIQSAGLTYPVADAPVGVRNGPHGLTGVIRLPLADLVAIARNHLDRGFTTKECAQYSLRPCPSGTSGLASPSATGPAAVPTGSAVAERAATPKPLAGTTVTILTRAWDGYRLSDELRAFQDATGITVDVYKSSALLDRERPDVSVSYWLPGQLAEIALSERSIDLSTYLDVRETRELLGDRLLRAGMVGSALYSLPLEFELEDLVWYPVRAFEQAGYQVPRTWHELITLTNQMVTDGRTPWCLGISDEPLSGWPLTDWLEAAVLRVGGAEIYDRWTRHEVPFDDPAVRHAGERVSQALLGQSFVRGGSTLAGALDPHGASAPLFASPPGCWMYQGSSYTTVEATWRTGGAGILGEGFDYFVLPPVSASTRPVLLGGGAAAMALNDRPEVRELVRYIAGRHWGEVGAQQIRGFIPPRVDFAAGGCTNSALTLAANTVRVRLCQDARAALAGDQWRYDGSFSMPAVIGGIDADGTGGAFYAGMVDYLNQGPDSLNGILEEIDEAWPTS